MWETESFPSLADKTGIKTDKNNIRNPDDQFQKYYLSQPQLLLVPLHVESKGSLLDQFLLVVQANNNNLVLSKGLFGCQNWQISSRSS